MSGGRASMACISSYRIWVSPSLNQHRHTLLATAVRSSRVLPLPVATAGYRAGKQLSYSAVDLTRPTSTHGQLADNQALVSDRNCSNASFTPRHSFIVSNRCSRLTYDAGLNCTSKPLASAGCTNAPPIVRTPDADKDSAVAFGSSTAKATVCTPSPSLFKDPVKGRGLLGWRNQF